MGLVLETSEDIVLRQIGCKHCPSLKNSSRPARSPRVKTTRRRTVEWLDRREAARTQSPRQPIYLNLKRKAPEKPEPETFLLPRAAEPREEDFMRNKAAPVFHSSNHVLVPCEFRHTGPGVSEAELLECLYRVGDDKYQGKGCAWMAWRLVGQLSLLTSATTSCFDPKEGQTCGSSSTSPP